MKDVQERLHFLEKLWPYVIIKVRVQNYNQYYDNVNMKYLLLTDTLVSSSGL